MPFEISPEFKPVEVNPRFQKCADAILRGCAVTKPLVGNLNRGLTEACALGAMLIGDGRTEALGGSCLADDFHWSAEDKAMLDAYQQRYGVAVSEDNDSGAYTREAIAARIAAL